jgi:SSS family solute:Na+ symporter
MDISSLSLLLIASYLIILKFLSVFAYRRAVSETEDFFLVGRSLPKGLLVGTILATIVNGLAVTAVPALIYEGGILFSQMFVVTAVVSLFIWLFGPTISRLGRNYGAITQGELFGKYYRSRALAILVGILGILSILPFMCIQLSAIGKILASISSGALPYEVGVLLCTVSVGLYLYFGGARAVVWTDAIQSIAFLFVVLTTACLFLYWAGGPSKVSITLLELMPEKLQFTAKNTPRFVDNILSWPFAFFLWPQLFQRMLMAKDEQAVKRSASYTFVLLGLVICCSMISGSSATSMLYGQIADSDQLIAEMYSRYLPAGGALIVLAAFATGMSTVDSMLLTLSSICVRDIARLESRKSPQAAFVWSRGIALAFLLLVTLLALSELGRGAMTPLVTLGASIATLFLWPLLGLHPRVELSGRACMACISSGLLAILSVKGTGVSADLPFGFATAGFASSLLVFSSIQVSYALRTKRRKLSSTVKESQSEILEEKRKQVVNE